MYANKKNRLPFFFLPELPEIPDGRHRFTRLKEKKFNFDNSIIVKKKKK